MFATPKGNNAVLWEKGQVKVLWMRISSFMFRYGELRFILTSGAFLVMYVLLLLPLGHGYGTVPERNDGCVRCSLSTRGLAR